MRTGEFPQVIRLVLLVRTTIVLKEHTTKRTIKKTTKKIIMGNGKGSRREERYYTKGNGHEVRKASQWVLQQGYT